MLLKVGDKAPSFTLKASDKSDVSLADYEGKNLLVLFFPLAFTGVCTTELCTIRDEKSEYEALNTNIVAISIDTIFSLDKFKSEEGYNFPLLSDFNKDVCRAYGTLYEEFVLGMKEVSKRSAFVVDKAGDIRYAEILENAGELPNFEEIKKTLAKLD